MLLIKTKSVGMWDVHCFHLVPKSPTLGQKSARPSYHGVGMSITGYGAITTAAAAAELCPAGYIIAIRVIIARAHLSSHLGPSAPARHP